MLFSKGGTLVGALAGCLPCGAGFCLPVCQSHCLPVLVCVSLAATAAATGTATRSRFPVSFRPEHLLTHSGVSHSLIRSHKYMHIHLPPSFPPSLPCLTATPSCRTAQVLAGLFWGEHDVTGGRGGGGNGSEAYSPGPVNDNVASHRPCPCVRPALDCLEDALGGGVEESFYGLVVLGRDFSVCGEWWRERRVRKDRSDEQWHDGEG